MAERTLSNISYPIDQFVGGSRGGSWSGLLNTDTGAPVSLPAFTDRTVQVYGTFGAGGTIVFEGSIDGTNWFQLTKPAGTALSFTAAGGSAVVESTGYIRPRVSAGDGTTNLSAVFFAVNRGQ